MTDRGRGAWFRGVVESDPSMVMTYVSRSVASLLGYQPVDLIGTVMTDLVHPDDVARDADGKVTGFLGSLRDASGQVTARADAAMYGAKEAGGDRLVVLEATTSSPEHERGGPCGVG